MTKKHCVLRDYSRGLLPLDGLIPDCIPALVKAAVVLFDVFPRVHGAASGLLRRPGTGRRACPDRCSCRRSGTVGSGLQDPWTGDILLQQARVGEQIPVGWKLL